MVCEVPIGVEVFTEEVILFSIVYGGNLAGDIKVLLKFLSERQGRTTPTTHDSRGFNSSEPSPETIPN